MAYAPINERLLGSFVEKDYGKTFEYTDNPENPWHVDLATGRLTPFRHYVFVGPLQEMRRALVKKSVAYVVTDERWYDGNPMWTIERWHIKEHRIYSK